MVFSKWSDDVARMLFEQSPFSSVLYDPQGHILAANAAFAKLWGVDVSTAPPDYCVLNDPELERQGALPLIRKAFAGQAVTTPALRYDISKLSTTGEGKVLWTQGHFYPLLDEHGAVRMVMLSHIDLTDHMEAEVKLRYAVADLQTLQSLTAGLATAITTDQVAGIMLDRARPAFGASGGFVTVLDDHEFTVLRYEGFRPDEFANWTRFPLAAATASGDAVRTGQPVFVMSPAEIHERYPIFEDILRRHGYKAFVSLPLHAHGKAIGTVVFHFNRAHPINETQEETLIAFARQCALAMERALLYDSERSARAEAEAANRAKSRFLANMSHELRTPLNAIDGYAELLEIGIRGELNPDQQLDIARIRRSQKHLLSLIDDLLNFARIESGSVEVNLHPVSVAEAVNAAQDVIAPQVSAKGLEFDNRAHALPWEVAADRAKLHQVLLNLLANAVKFTDRGKITVSATQQDGRVYINVTDTGRGIPHDRLEDIFQPFVQVESGPTRTASGTGLGLAIARDLARRMRGDISARSKAGAGSTFTITLPLAGSQPDGSNE
ncbi:MAG TPA: ATP-binding protein [Longimicrobiales bacterium]